MPRVSVASEGIEFKEHNRSEVVNCFYTLTFPIVSISKELLFLL